MGYLNMKDYLAIIRKSDFVDLFKYGKFGISYAVDFDGNIQGHANDDLFDRLVARMNMYEYSFEYLIIHFKAKDFNAQRIVIDISEVQALYTFDEEAQKEMSISFDDRIQLQVSPWAARFEDRQRKINIKQNRRGVDNLWAVWELTEEDRRKCEQIITPEIVDEVFCEQYKNERPSGNLPVWVYLLRYERHSSYHQGMLGFFCDAINVFCNYKSQKEVEDEVAETTTVYSAISGSKSDKITDLLAKAEGTSFSKQTQEVSGCEYVKAAPLFFFLKNKFAEGMSHKPDEKITKYAKTVGGFECSIAVYLLGLVLGYDKTYDAFYETADLQLFKKGKEESSHDKQEECTNATHALPSHDIETDNNEVELAEERKEAALSALTISSGTAKQQNSSSVQPVQETLPSSDCENKEKQPIEWMKSRNSKDVKPAYNNKEKNAFIEKGYEEIKRFTKAVKEEIKLQGFDPDAEKKRLAEKKK